MHILCTCDAYKQEIGIAIQLMLLGVGEILRRRQPHILHSLQILSHLEQGGPFFVCQCFQALFECGLWVLGGC